MRRGDFWNAPLPRPATAWLVAGVLLFISLLWATVLRWLWIVPVVAAAVLLVPRIRPIYRNAGVVFLIGLGALGWALPLESGFHIVAVLWLSAAGVVAGLVAREEGLGIPLGQIVRAPRVQAGAALFFCVLASIAGLWLMDYNLKRSALAPEWRWSFLPLILLMLAPARIVGGKLRLIWGVAAMIAGFVYMITREETKATIMVFRSGFLTFQLLGLAVAGHEAYAKRFPRAGSSRSDDATSPLRVHTGEGLP